MPSPVSSVKQFLLDLSLSLRFVGYQHSFYKSSSTSLLPCDSRLMQNRVDKASEILKAGHKKERYVLLFLSVCSVDIHAVVHIIL